MGRKRMPVTTIITRYNTKRAGQRAATSRVKLNHPRKRIRALMILDP
jgi:hypothetical protein